MPDLNISKKKINELFSKNAKFLIPDYQRPYSWGKEECETLWEDLKNFALPESGEFEDDNYEYFLGTIVTFKNPSKENEVIDGQQRLTTLLLLLRAFYEAFDDKSSDNAKEIAKCIWKINLDYTPDKSHCKIKSVVATDEDIAEFNKIIATGETTKGNKSNYAENYRYFQNKFAEDLKAAEFIPFSARILNNCIVMPIEANSSNTAFKIFTTLNDRGLPLSDSDIFKSQFYKFFQSQGDKEKSNFVQRWKELETLCNDIFHPRTGTPIDDLFMKYMYFLLAKEKTKSDTFIGLRPYYEKNDYEVLKSEKAFEDLVTLANFWNDIFARKEERFSPRVLKCLYVLNYSPYNIWSYIVSLYFMGNRDAQNNLNDEKFYKFLQKITAMLLMQAVTNPGNQNVRRPFFLEFQNILHGEELIFEQYKQNENLFRTQLANTKFSNSKRITRAILAWWLFQKEEQELPPLDTKLEIEHIYAKKLHETKPLENKENLELLGNKSLLEKRINIYSSNLPFANKKIYYLGQANKKNSTPTFNLELFKLAQKQEDFTESDILERNEKIFNGFINYLAENKLLK